MTTFDEDLAGLRAQPGPFGRTYFRHALAESDTRALVNALWVLRHSAAGDVSVVAAELMAFYARRYRGMYGLAGVATAVDDACAAVVAASSKEAVAAILADVAARVGELNFLIDQGLPPAALAEAFAAATG